MSSGETPQQGNRFEPLLGHDKSVQFAVFGDAEPKPEPEFPNLRAAVRLVEEVHDQRPFDFVAGIGDLPHKGKLTQYEQIADILDTLSPPLYPILGNEELPGNAEDIERFLKFATEWNGGSPAVETTRYTMDVDGTRFVFASADTDGKNFSSEEVDWIYDQLEDAGDRPVVLFIHTPPQGVFPDGRAMSANNFGRVSGHDNLDVVFSGHSHMNLNVVESHAISESGTHHIHVPGLERTKVGETHVPWLRLAVITPNRELAIETYNLETENFDADHRIRIPLRR